LKRKDWLLQDATKKTQPDMESLIESLENGVQWFNQIEVDHKEAEQQFGKGYMDGDDDLQIRDYAQYLGELKTSLWSFVKEHPDEELETKMNQLESAQRLDQAIHDLNTILFLLKSRA
jgi:hypothetical protein